MKRATYLPVILLLSANCFAQGHFVVAFTGNGQEHMNLNVVTATIDGVALGAGDEIAVFDGSICCGKAILTQTIVISDKITFAAIAASKKDDGYSNGYTVGNAIIYKFWDSNENKEISGVTAEYLDPATGQLTTAPTYSANQTAFVKLSAAKQVSQTQKANAGPDQSVNEGDDVSLDGSASADSDGDTLTYKWTAPTEIILSSETDSKPTFTALEVSEDTDYTFSLVVNDGKADSPADEVVITILNVDHAPYIKDPLKNISVDIGAPDQIIDLKSVFADDDIGDLLSFSVTSNENDQVVQTNISGSHLTLSFSTENIGSSEILITAGSNGKEAKSKFKVEVKTLTGIDPMIADGEVLIYPNPTKNRVWLKFNQTPKAGTWITVYSISGKMISKSLACKKEENLSLKGKPSGLYFINIQQRTPKTYKLVLE